jgi:hypothetical protein
MPKWRRSLGISTIQLLATAGQRNKDAVYLHTSTPVWSLNTPSKRRCGTSSHYSLRMLLSVYHRRLFNYISTLGPRLSSQLNIESPTMYRHVASCFSPTSHTCFLSADQEAKQPLHDSTVDLNRLFDNKYWPCNHSIDFRCTRRIRNNTQE